MTVRQVLVTCSGAAGTLSALSGATGLKARAIKYRPDAANSGTVRIGGPDVSNTVGYPVLKTDAVSDLPYASAEVFTDLYDLDTIYAFGANNDLLYLLLVTG